MTITTVPASLKAAVGDKIADYHHFVLADGIVWAFSRIYHEQKSYNWGHRVTHKGGYAIAFDTKTNSWGKPVDFDPLFSEENSEEVVFSLSNVPYLLITAGFSELTVHGLYKWTGSSWESVPLTTPENLIVFNEKVNVRPTILDSNSTTERYLVFSVSHNLHLYEIRFNETGAVLTPSGVVPVEQLAVIAPLASSGVVSGNHVIISYNSLGCGYMWESSKFVTYNTTTGTFNHISTTESDGQDRPRFGESGGGAITGLSPSGDWVHASGRSRYGMCDSRHEPSVWLLKNLEGELNWTKTNLEIPEEFSDGGVLNSKTGEIIAIGKEAVAKLTL